MARVFRKADGPGRAPVARLGVISIFAAAALTALSVAAAVPATAAQSVPATGFNLASQATGSVVNLFGTEVTGGNSSACVNDSAAIANGASVANKNDDGTASLCDQQPAAYAAAEGAGTLVTTSGVHIDQKATEASPGKTDGSSTPTCSQGGSTPSGIPVAVSVGASCGYAVASQDASGNPSASSMGEVANFTVSLNGLLSPILGAAPSSGSADSCSNTGTVGLLLNTVCTALSTVSNVAPSFAGTVLGGIDQALQNLYNVVTNDADPTIAIDMGQTGSSVATTTNTLTSQSHGSTLDLKILPGVGCAAPSGVSAAPTLAQCAADAATGHPQDSAPLVEVVISPAETGSSYSGGTWTPTATGSIGTVHVNIPGNEQVIPLSPGVDQTILAGTPLQSTINLGSVETTQTAAGATAIAHGAVIQLLQSAT
ncbi:MAG TPA: hypothetical protein VMR97_06835, partial [Acidimicrobiales bacterium]|nr:hypothetical protein [Acidimicrobiales bacterium]